MTVFGSTLWVVSSGSVPAPRRCPPVRQPEIREQALPGKGAPGPEGRFVRAAQALPLLWRQQAAGDQGRSRSRRSVR